MHKSFIYSLLIHALLICSSVLLFSCSKSDEQRQFENEALSPPFTGITEMTEHNCEQPEGGQTDPDDWRTSPNFAGHITIQCEAYPNPVQYNQDFFIEIDLGYTDTVERMYFYVINPNTNVQSPIGSFMDLATIDRYQFNSDYFASSTGVSTSNVFRILIYDGRDNLISYGDVQVGGQ